MTLTPEEQLQNLESHRTKIDSEIQKMKHQLKNLEPSSMAAKDHKVAIKQQTEKVKELDHQISVLKGEESEPTPSVENPNVSS